MSLPHKGMVVGVGRETAADTSVPPLDGGENSSPTGACRRIFCIEQPGSVSCSSRFSELSFLHRGIIKRQELSLLSHLVGSTFISSPLPARQPKPALLQPFSPAF